MQGSCPKCSRTFEISDEFLALGGSAKCPHCVLDLVFLSLDTDHSLDSLDHQEAFEKEDTHVQEALQETQIVNMDAETFSRLMSNETKDTDKKGSTPDLPLAPLEDTEFQERGLDVIEEENPDFLKTEAISESLESFGPVKADHKNTRPKENKPLGTVENEIISREDSNLRGNDANALMDDEDWDPLPKTDPKPQEKEPPAPPAQPKDAAPLFPTRPQQQRIQPGLPSSASLEMAWPKRLINLPPFYTGPGLLLFSVMVLWVVWLVLDTTEKADDFDFPVSDQIITSARPRGYTARQSVKKHYGLGNRCAYKGDFEKAIIKYRQASRMDPNYPAPQRALGAMYAVLGKTELSFRAYENYIQLSPESPDVDKLRSFLRMHPPEQDEE
jgi:tetratricopeptide (TPR) repeat protein